MIKIPLNTFKKLKAQILKLIKHYFSIDILFRCFTLKKIVILKLIQSTLNK